MNKNFQLKGLLMSLSLLSLPLMAAEVSNEISVSPLIKAIQYKEKEVVPIRIKQGFGTRIIFAKDETILDVGAGSNDGWEFYPRRNMIYIKLPQASAAHSGKLQTNLMVATNKRVYDFELLSDERYVNQPPYRIEFLYPDEKLEESSPNRSGKASWDMFGELS